MRLSISCCSQSAGLSKPGVRTVPWQPVVEQESREVVNFEQDMPRGHPHAATGSRSWHQPGDTSGDMGFLGAEALGTGAAPPPAEEKTVTKESAHSRLKYRQRSVLGQISGGRASLRGSRGHQPGRGDGRGGKAPDPEPCRGGAPPPLQPKQQSIFHSWSRGEDTSIQSWPTQLIAQGSRAREQVEHPPAGFLC